MRIVRYNYPSYRTFVTAPTFTRSPWSAFETEVDRLFASVQVPALAPEFPVDVFQDEANAYVRAELPGVSREDIQVELTEENLTISATRKTAKTSDREEQTSTLSRSLTVPAEVSGDKVSATYENGVLTVTLPKREEAKPKKVTVEVK